MMIEGRYPEKPKRRAGELDVPSPTRSSFMLHPKGCGRRVRHPQKLLRQRRSGARIDGSLAHAQQRRVGHPQTHLNQLQRQKQNQTT